MPRVSKRLIYQKAAWLSPTTQSLQQSFLAAWRARRGRNRQQPLDTDQQSLREAIAVRDIQGCCFGKLISFTHGLRQETVRTRRTDPAAPLEGSVAPPEGEEWSEGALYFAIDGDHIVLAQSQGLHIAQLEAYLNWLMTNANVLAEGNAVALNSLPPSAARRILERSVPKSVTFSRPVEIGREDTVTPNRTFTADATISALQALLGVDDIREMLPANAAPSGRVKTEITLSWSQRVGGERPDAFLTGLGRHALRHLDEDPSLNVEIETSAGKFSARQLSLAQSKMINAPDGVVPTLDVYRLLGNFLADLRSRNEIAD